MGGYRLPVWQWINYMRAMAQPVNNLPSSNMAKRDKGKTQRVISYILPMHPDGVGYTKIIRGISIASNDEYHTLAFVSFFYYGHRLFMVLVCENPALQKSSVFISRMGIILHGLLLRKHQ